MNTIRTFIYATLFSFLVYTVSFLTVLGLGLNDKVLQSEDYLGTAALPFSIIKEHNLNLDEYSHELMLNYPQPDNMLQTPYYLRKSTDKHIYSIRPILTSILVLPIYLPVVWMNQTIDINTIELASRLGGALITAVSCGFFALLLKHCLENFHIDKKELKTKKLLSILIFIVYAFGTNSLSTSSQGLWQHGTSQLFLTLGALFWLKKFYIPMGLSLGLAFINRPTNLLSAVIFGLYLLFSGLSKEKSQRDLKKSYKYAFGFIIPIIIQLCINKLFLGTLDNEGYANQFNGWTKNILEGFLGIWLSPSKGILINSPIFIFILPVIFDQLKRIFTKFKSIKENGTLSLFGFNERSNDIYFISTIILFLHTLIMGSWYSWYGGYSWGYRMASDVLPFMTILLVPGLKNILQKTSTKIIAITLTIISVFMHFMGLIFFDGIWHTLYDGKSRWWLWSINNSEIVFDIKRLFYKFGILKTNPYIKA